MKCITCDAKVESVEITETLGIKVSYCCGEIQVDYNSLRENVKTGIVEDIEFFAKLTEELQKDSD